MKINKQRDETEQMIPPSQESEGTELDPGCYDQAAPRITMMSPAGERNAKAAGNVVDWRNSMIRRTP